MGMPVGESDRARLRAIAASDRPLAPHECAERARLAASLVEPGRLDRSGAGEAVLLWRDEHSEAWLNLWWQPRDTGYHDHSGSCVGVHVIEGRAWNEPLTIGEPPKARQYGPGETFWFPGEGIHRMDHQAGAITIHVYSPPIQAIGHYDLHDGQLRRTEVLPDQPSPPSAALYEALHRPAGASQASHGRSEDLRRCRGMKDHALCLTLRDGSRLKRTLPPSCIVPGRCRTLVGNAHIAGRSECSRRRPGSRGGPGGHGRAVCSWDRAVGSYGRLGHPPAPPQIPVS